MVGSQFLSVVRSSLVSVRFVRDQIRIVNLLCARILYITTVSPIVASASDSRGGGSAGGGGSGVGSVRGDWAIVDWSWKSVINRIFSKTMPPTRKMTAASPRSRNDRRCLHRRLPPPSRPITSISKRSLDNRMPWDSSSPIGMWGRGGTAIVRWLFAMQKSIFALM